MDPRGFKTSSKKKPFVQKLKPRKEANFGVMTATSVLAESGKSGEQSGLELKRKVELIAKQKSQRCIENVDEDTVEDCRFSGDLDEEDLTEFDNDSDDDTVDSDIERSGTKSPADDMKRELSTMSFEEIVKLQNKVGTKVYNQVAYGTERNRTQGRRKRLNKNRPMEISAKKPAPFLRHVVPIKKTILRDPRFDDLSGDYKPEIFEKTYSFISDIKRKEKEVIRKKLKKVKAPRKKEQLELQLKRMVNQETAQKHKEMQREKELEFKRKQREMVAQGHRPFFLKKSDKRRLELADKYGDLKKSGKLDNFMSKKRKHNAMKDRRKLPFHQKALWEETA